MALQSKTRPGLKDVRQQHTSHFLLHFSILEPNPNEDVRQNEKQNSGDYHQKRNAEENPQKCRIMTDETKDRIEAPLSVEEHIALEMAMAREAAAARMAITQQSEACAEKTKENTPTPECQTDLEMATVIEEGWQQPEAFEGAKSTTEIEDQAHPVQSSQEGGRRQLLAFSVIVFVVALIISALLLLPLYPSGNSAT